MSIHVPTKLARSVAQELVARFSIAIGITTIDVIREHRAVVEYIAARHVRESRFNMDIVGQSHFVEDDMLVVDVSYPRPLNIEKRGMMA